MRLLNNSEHAAKLISTYILQGGSFNWKVNAITVSYSVIFCIVTSVSLLGEELVSSLRELEIKLRSMQWPHRPIGEEISRVLIIISASLRAPRPELIPLPWHYRANENFRVIPSYLSLNPIIFFLCPPAKRKYLEKKPLRVLDNQGTLHFSFSFSLFLLLTFSRKERSTGWTDELKIDREGTTKKNRALEKKIEIERDCMKTKHEKE